ncbi:MAG: Flp pilus assembly protein CpaB [Bdellovibrionota bacterium]
MNNKALTMSLAMAVFAVFMVSSYVTSIEDEAKKKFGTEIPVVVAKRDIKEAETINETMVEIRNFPARFLEPAAIRLTAAAEDDSERSKGITQTVKSLSGTVAVVPIKKGEQITYNKIIEPGVRTGLAPQVTPGRRAVSVPVNDITGVSRLVKPGDRVDLIAILDVGGGKENKIAKTVMQDVVVLAVGKNVTNNVARIADQDSAGREKFRSLAEDTSFGSVTLEVEPAQAQALALVIGNGDAAISLSLRNNDDTERNGIPAITYGDVLGADSVRVRRPASGR